MADFDGQQVDLIELTSGRSAAQLIAYAATRQFISIRRTFGPGWFLTIKDADKRTGKAPTDG